MIMMPVRRTQNWLPSIFNDFFDNDWMIKANATAPAINVLKRKRIQSRVGRSRNDKRRLQRTYR